MVGAIAQRGGCKDSSWLKRRPRQPKVLLALSHRTDSYGPRQLIFDRASRAWRAAILDILFTCHPHDRRATASGSNARCVTAQGNPPSKRATCGGKHAADVTSTVQARAAEQRPVAGTAQGSRSAPSDKGGRIANNTDPESMNPTIDAVSENMAINLQPSSQSPASGLLNNSSLAWPHALAAATGRPCQIAPEPGQLSRARRSMADG